MSIFWTCVLAPFPFWMLLGWFIWWNLHWWRRDRRAVMAAAHMRLRFGDMGKGDMGKHERVITVAELLERAVDNGRPVRLNWSIEDTDPRGLAAIRDDDDWPTGVLPRIPASDNTRVADPDNNCEES
jgi:hypothetical protein